MASQNRRPIQKRIIDYIKITPKEVNKEENLAGPRREVKRLRHNILVFETDQGYLIEPPAGVSFILLSELMYKLKLRSVPKLQLLYAIRIGGGNIAVFYQGDNQEHLSISIDDPNDIEEVNPDGEILELSLEELSLLKEHIIPYDSKKQIRINEEDYRIELISDKGTEEVIFAIPDRIEAYSIPGSELLKFAIVWRTPKRTLKTIGDTETITQMLIREALAVATKQKVHNVVNRILSTFIDLGIIPIDIDRTRPGFFLVNGRVLPIGIEVREPDTAKLRKALETLRKLSEFFDERIFATVIRWGFVAPFSYILKQRIRHDIPFHWLYLWGYAGTGKSTLAKIVLKIWGSEDNIVGGSAIDTIPRFGETISRTTLPILVNEVMLNNQEIIDIIKHAIESTVARKKFVGGNYIEIPALAPLVMTSNHAPPNDGGFLRRVIVIPFTPSMRPSDEEKRKFNEIFKKADLAEIGNAIAWLAINDKISLAGDWRSISYNIILNLERLANVSLQWLLKEYEGEDEKEDYTEDLIIGTLKEMLIDCMIKLKRSWYSNVDQQTASSFVAMIAESGLCPWIEGRGDYVYLNSNVVRELKKRANISITLKWLGEVIPNSEYVMIHGRRRLKIPIEEFAKWVFSNDSIG